MIYTEKAFRERKASAESKHQTPTMCLNRAYNPAKNFRMRSNPRSNSAFEVA
jgi:hypothetical protein